MCEHCNDQMVRNGQIGRDVWKSIKTVKMHFLTQTVNKLNKALDPT